MVNIYFCTCLCVYRVLLLSCFGCSLYILLLCIIPPSFYANHATKSYPIIHVVPELYMENMESTKHTCDNFKLKMCPCENLTFRLEPMGCQSLLKAHFQLE